MFNIGSSELILILVIVLILFGGKKIPELTRSIGEAINEFKKGFSDGSSEKKTSTESDSKNT